MSCSNCYNGCTEIVSDKCVKYTGIDVPVLGIQNGDSLSYVEQAIVEFLTSTLDGTGIILNIDSQIICETVNKYIVECSELTLVNITNAIIKATCDIQGQLNSLADTVAEINGEFNIGCLEGVESTSTNHQVLQAVITKLCEVDTALAAFILNVETNYVKLSDLDALIADYLANQSVSTKVYGKMVPYVAVEYYGDLTGKFDTTGAGIGDWEKIYLCNGNNGTPDKRGRVAVGAIVGMGGGALSPSVDPSYTINPNYALGTTAGVNAVTLTTLQIPAHTHIASVTINDPGHTHTYIKPNAEGSATGNAVSHPDGPLVNAQTAESTTGLNGSNVIVNNASTGGGESHANIQPSIACYYIMYIPS